MESMVRTYLLQRFRSLPAGRIELGDPIHPVGRIGTSKARDSRQGPAARSVLAKHLSDAGELMRADLLERRPMFSDLVPR